MTGFGVQRLVVINSGGYHFADVAMDGPIHLVAPNNRGKSTLVNALQFLYVDDIRKMRFPRSPDETREHYFGSAPSYLLFECVTALGPQTLLVVGRGRLAGSAFARYVFAGGFQQEDFQDTDGRVAVFDLVQARLANRSLLEVKQSQLWEVLCTASRRARTAQNTGHLPQLGLLPIRTREDYRSFREAYVRLLSLSDMSAAELRQLLIDCHASEVGELKLDVAAEYRDEFERAERTESQLAFLEAIGPMIDDGEQRRERLSAYRSRIADELPVRLSDVTKLLQACRTREVAAQETTRGIVESLAQLETQRGELHTEKGKLQAKLEHVQRDLAELDTAHSKWCSVTPQMLDTMRDNASTTRDAIASKKELLRQAGTFDHDAMRRSVRSLQREADSQERSLEHWERQVRGWLVEQGVASETISKAFRVLNPGLLRLVIGDDVTVARPEELLARIAALAEHVESDTYDDGRVQVRLASLGGPDLSEHDDPEAARALLRITKARLEDDLKRLHVAEDIERAHAELAEIEQRHAEQAERLAQYDDYHRQWDRRPERVSEQVQLSQKLTEIDTRLDALRAKEVEIGQKRDQINQNAKAIRDRQDQLRDAKRDVEVALEVAGMADLCTLSNADDAEDASTDLFRRCDECVATLKVIAKQAADCKHERDRLSAIQRRITESAREHSRGPYFVGDEEQDWRELIGTRRAMSELYQANQQSWDALFTTIRARLDALMRGVRAISNAATRVNSAMKHHRVSNLREVQLSVTRQHEACDLLESLTGPDGLFADRETLDRARDRLRRWIKDGKVIRLQDLFAIRIRVQGMDGHWTEAKSLDEIGSTGTGMTAKAMIFIQLVRAVVADERYRLHFYLDETGQLDDKNLHATTAMAVGRGVVPITAEPRVRAEPLAHPSVTVYSLGQDTMGRFFIDARRTLRAKQRVPIEESVQDVAN